MTDQRNVGAVDRACSRPIGRVAEPPLTTGDQA